MSFLLGNKIKIGIVFLVLFVIKGQLLAETALVTTNVDNITSFYQIDARNCGVKAAKDIPSVTGKVIKASFSNALRILVSNAGKRTIRELQGRKWKTIIQAELKPLSFVWLNELDSLLVSTEDLQSLSMFSKHGAFKGSAMRLRNQVTSLRATNATGEIRYTALTHEGPVVYAADIVTQDVQKMSAHGCIEASEYPVVTLCATQNRRYELVVAESRKQKKVFSDNVQAFEHTELGFVALLRGAQREILIGRRGVDGFDINSCSLDTVPGIITAVGWSQ